MDKHLSEAFNLLRFPLAVFVVYLHIDTVTDAAIVQSIDWEAVSGWDLLYYRITYAICILARCAVPCFFLISGYLVIINVSSPTWSAYINKLAKRFKTLLVPYVLWNVLAAVYIHFSVGMCWRFYDIFIAPANFPLWFLRNLIILNIILPVIFLYCKCLKESGLVFLLLFFLFQSLFSVSDEFTVQSLFFFYLGFYLGLKKMSINSVPKWFLSFNFSLFCVLFAVLQFYWRHDLIVVRQLFLLTGVIVMIHVAYRVSQYRGCRWLMLLSSSSFFIYAAHKLGPTYISKTVLRYCLPGFEATNLIVFILAPLLTVLICAVIYFLVRGICPKILYLFTGGK